ncbi:hypothetical protein MFLAVUS_005131 [Mucor flavus]|uniref:Uncharacterized protein n=1 Tax=Mucor flavus TaxID=439312 RepID=A0ABP9YXU1_9FUNG
MLCVPIFDVYNLHRHTHCVAFYIREDTIVRSIYSTLTRNIKDGKDSWNQDDLFLFKAISDFLRLFVEKLMEEENKDGAQIKGTDALHYVFAVPSEWEEEIREVLIRDIFVRADLISKNDHKDRLLFCTDVESFYYYITGHRSMEESKASMVLNLILVGNPLYDFSNSLLFPKLVAYDSFFLTTSDVKNGIREFIKTKFSFDAQEETIRNIMEEIHPEISKQIPFITGKSISKLDKTYETLIESIRPIDICAEISKTLPNSLKLLLQNEPMKEYTLLNPSTKRWRRKVDKGLLDWLEHLLEYNRVSFGSSYIITKRLWNMDYDYSEVLEGTGQYLFDALHNSDVYSKPRILSTEHLATSSSIFLKSKPDAIMNIDISLESTTLSFSLLDENGLVKEIWNHDYFVPDARVGDILNVDRQNKDVLVSTQQQVYIKSWQQLQRRLFGTEDNLRDRIYASNLLTLSQVVTESGSENGYQEAVIIQEEIITIPNIYDSLCLIMWKNIAEDSSVIQLCDTHEEYDNNKLLEIFTLENRAEFTNNLKEFISKNSQHILMKILKDETDAFLYGEGIDVAHYTLPKLSNQLLQPVLQQEPFSYKAFQVGALYHVYSDNYGFGPQMRGSKISYKLKHKISDSKTTSIDKETVLKKAGSLSFEETVHAEDTLEKIGGPACSVFDHKPGYSSSVSLSIIKAGDEMQKKYFITLANPMTLARF